MCDEDGRLYLIERAKDLVIVSGFNVYPAEVEDILAAHPAVADVGVIGVPHPHTGEAVRAYVVLAEGATIDEDALIASVKKTNRAVVAHEAVTRMGWGAEVAAVVQEKAFDYLDAPIARVGAKFTPIPFAPAMEEWVVPHVKDVLAAIKKTVGKE